MKIKYLIMMSLLVGFAGEMQAKDKKMYNKKARQCYCSDKCGLRDFDPTPTDEKPKGDKPFIATVEDHKGQLVNVCFCHERDLRNYDKNQCALDKKPKTGKNLYCK